MVKSLKILFFLPAIGLMISFTRLNGRTVNHERSDEIVQTDTAVVSRWIKIDPFKLAVTPPSSGVRFYREGIVFLSSSRDEAKIGESHISFGNLDARYGTIMDSVPGSINEFSSSVSFPFPCEAVTFTNNYDTMYFTKYSRKEGAAKIFCAVCSHTDGKEGNWTLSDEPLNFCKGKSSYTHPALSKDGKLIVFASDREGSIGGMDLYASLKKNGNWTEPVNLGDAVNSTANELYPFLDSENNLFFSSDGPEGYGGYDVYVCKFKGNTWEKPVNLSSTINSKYDDVAFSISRNDQKTGFYTVKQQSGKGTFQLYKISMREPVADSVLNLSQFFTRPDISQMVILALEPAVQASDKASETATLTRGEKDTITYRVQFMTSFNPRTRQSISAGGKDYSVFEFLYSGAYRLCVGKFLSLSSAIELQDLLRKGEYPRAMVIAFKNNVISLDPELLKEPSNSGNKPDTQKSGPEQADILPVSEPSATGKDNENSKIADTINNPITKPVNIEPSGKKEVVVYRVQVSTNTTPKGNFKINVSGKSFDTFEYKFSGAYRTCIGEFASLSSATEFQKVCRQNGYPQAFVVAFKNNTRTNDPSLFR